MRGGDDGCPSGSSQPPPTLPDKLRRLLDYISSPNKSTDEPRPEEIERIKRALADGTYDVSAAAVARKIIDQMERRLVQSDNPKSD